MRVDSVLDGWWLAVAGSEPRQAHEGDEYDLLTTRGPFRTREDAEAATYRDHLAGYWEHGLSVYADHCLGCGKFAKVLAFDNEGGGWAWRVTECKNCGVIDSRERKK